MDGFVKIWAVFLTAFMVLVWTFIGWPQIWNSPRIPPRVNVAQAADVTIDTGDTTPIAGHNAPRALVWASSTTGYFFYIDSDNDFKYAKTIDGGQNWSAAVAEIDTDTTITALAFDVWYDKWTPGDNGTLIHIWWSQVDLDDIFYRALDTSDDSLGTMRTVFAHTAAASNRANFVSGTKSRGGNLYAVGTIDAATVCEFGRSTDGGTTWDVTRASPQEVCGDQGFLFPANLADSNDIWMLYDDISTDLLTLKTNDDSANSWSESATIVASVENTTLGTGEYPFSGSIRHSDGHLIAATHSAFDLSTTDFQIWDITNESTITQKTAITTDKDDNYYSSVFIDQNTDDIYIAYSGTRDGLQTLGTTVGIYYTKSTDGGTNWTAGDTAYSAGTGNYRQNWAGMMGNRFGVVWRNDATEALLFNYDNSVDVTPAPSNSAPVVSTVDISPAPITLTENGTTTVTITATITDDNGCGDVLNNGTTTATLYRSGIGASCSQDFNNCYVNIKMASTTCSGTSGDASGTVQIWYIAQATDASSSFSGDTWQATVKAIDAANASSTATDASPPELNTLLAIDVTGSISYGTVNPTATSTTQTVTITNTGNFNSTDSNFSGVALESFANSIVVGSQKYSTTTNEFWDYMDFTLSGTPTFRELNITKGTATGTPSAQNNYWAIQVPNGTPAGTYNGTTTIEAQ
ncbi:hypothetical protein A2116_00520 [Candidatus Jorgensenbacteria bacterium GWA1_49_17]|uniref:Uncharacterized protein n=2 Tax=Candidatus Joergenseniibacteriota TaxID=1752739 RepID=A0A1F6BMB6_9BACT|nr:MAG: hypothetical protein A2127_00020 [Candidatus Jorgensenbacteria bacterium GWC1_48_12]OGG40649.1 MAG: hypothetical protein A2116_00520 [Candidatus Jorgensenbacteria bacterium GWA1_49_17]